MDKTRMQKLAGLNEGTVFKNGKFELDRWHGSTVSSGNWCQSKEVAELEQLASEMYGIINSIMSGLEKADRNYTPFKLTQANIRDMKSLLKKVNSL